MHYESYIASSKLPRLLCPYLHESNSSYYNACLMNIKHPASLIQYILNSINNNRLIEIIALTRFRPHIFFSNVKTSLKRSMLRRFKHYSNLFSSSSSLKSSIILWNCCMLCHDSPCTKQRRLSLILFGRNNGFCSQIYMRIGQSSARVLELALGLW